MMKKYWSRLNFMYERNLLYMLQQTEYNIGDYFAWTHRIKDFRDVQKRQTLVITRKIQLLFLALVAFVFVYMAAIFTAAVIINELWFYVAALILILLLPIVAQYEIVVPLVIGDLLIKKPLAKKRIVQAKAILARHGGHKIAIAGSYGKTTAKSVLEAVLSGGKKVAATPGNINQPLGFAKFIAGLDGDEDILIFEFGEYRPGDIAEMCEFIKPDAGFITGINDAHLENFKTQDALVADILDLQKYLGEKPLYLNGDSELLRKYDTKHSTLYSQRGLENISVKNVAITAMNTTFTLGKLTVTSGLLGRHNIGVVAASVDYAERLGLSDTEIQKGVATLRPFAHRMQPRVVNGATVIDDTYNGNLDGFRAGIELLKELPAKRKIYVTPGLVEQGAKTEENHQIIANLLTGAKFDKVVLMKNSATDIITKELQKNDYKGEVMTVDDPLTFYENLASFVATGDVVLMQNDWTDNYF
jgi:UDP-N-acetylmuramoyl-tripeptide--D-alanyl-D-alanine ligase